MQTLSQFVQEQRANGVSMVSVDLLDRFIAVDDVVEANRNMLLERSNVGVAKYGTTLSRSQLNIRQLHRHALEEVLDLANYIQAADMELDKVLAVLRRLVNGEFWARDDAIDLLKRYAK